MFSDPDLNDFRKNLTLGEQSFVDADDACFGDEMEQAKESCMKARAIALKFKQIF
jgi:hypothetical protein